MLFLIKQNISNIRNFCEPKMTREAPLATASKTIELRLVQGRFSCHFLLHNRKSLHKIIVKFWDLGFKPLNHNVKKV